MAIKYNTAQMLVGFLLLLFSTQLYAMNNNQVKEQLFDQVAIGEATFRYDLVSEALSRLELMSPDEPRVIAVQIRLLIYKHQLADAEEALQTLRKIAPKSKYYQKMYTLININKPMGAKKLFDAKVLALAGKYAQAKHALDKLYHGKPPTYKLAIEYWGIVAKIRDQRPLALKNLLSIYQKYQRLGVISEMPTEKDSWQVDLTKTIARMYVNEGEDFLRQKNIPKASYSFKKALEYSADNYYAYVGIGDVLFAKGNLALAKAAYEKANHRDPQGSLAHYGLIAVYEKQSAQRAMEYIESLSPFLQRKLTRAKKRLSSKTLQYQAEQYSKKGQWKKAIYLYEKALKLQPQDIWGTFSLAANYAKLGKLQQGISLLNKLAVKEQGNPEFVYAHALFYSKQNLDQRALAILQSLDRVKWSQDMLDLKKKIRFRSLQNRATQLVKSDKLQAALPIFKKLYQSAPNDVWLVYDYAVLLNDIGQRSQAMALFERLAKQQPNNSQQAYAYALFLSNIDYHKRALQQLNTIARSSWDSSMSALAARLLDTIHIELASALRKKGQYSEAEAYLKHQKPSKRILLTLASWALEDGTLRQAYHYYNKVLQAAPNNVTAYIGLINTYLADDRLNQAQTMLEKIQPRVKQLSIANQREIANAWMEVGYADKALAIFQRIVPIARKRASSQETGLIFRDSAALYERLQQPERAKTNYQWAMLHSGIASSLPLDDEIYTRLTRTDSEDDWMKRSIRAQAGDLYQQQSHVATLENDYWALKGTPGRSDYQAIDTIVHYRKPYRDGVFYARGDLVHLSAGRFDTQNGVFIDEFGTCQVGCTRDVNQKAAGFGMMAGWHNDTWRLGLGVTPIGFDIINPIIEIARNGEFNNLGWTLSALHTPLTNSLLSFSGAKDPNTGTTWGGVTSTGLNLALSYDRGGSHGVWANALASYLRGKNVANNQRIELMGGYYYKLINETQRRLTIGLTSLYWHYQKDLNRYTLGSGGYFSPQSFLTFSIPLSYRQRTDNWSWMLETSLGRNTTRTDNTPLYPVPSIVPRPLVSPNPIREGSSATTMSYYVLLGIERRLSSHFRLGGIVDIQRTPDFSPNHLLIYLRYTFEPWQGDLDMPLRPLPPLTDYR